MCMLPLGAPPSTTRKLLLSKGECIDNKEKHQFRSHHSRRRMLALLVIGTAGSAPLIGTADEWAPLRAGLDAWSALSFGANFSVAVGDENGTRFRWASPGFSTSHTLMAGASLSKWPAAIMMNARK